METDRPCGERIFFRSSIWSISSLITALFVVIVFASHAGSGSEESYEDSDTGSPVTPRASMSTLTSHQNRAQKHPHPPTDIENAPDFLIFGQPAHYYSSHGTRKSFRFDADRPPEGSINSCILELGPTGLVAKKASTPIVDIQEDHPRQLTELEGWSAEAERWDLDLHTRLKPNTRVKLSIPETAQTENSLLRELELFPIDYNLPLFLTLTGNAAETPHAPYGQFILKCANVKYLNFQLNSKLINRLALDGNRDSVTESKYCILL